MILFSELSNPPSKWEIQFLYQLLQSRQYSISHRKMPSFDNHQFFVLNHPYHTWHIVFYDEIPIGSIYICSDNSVGLHIMPEFISYRQSLLRKFIGTFTPLPGQASIINSNFIFNVALDDFTFVSDLKGCGAIPLQVTYLIKSESGNVLAE